MSDEQLKKAFNLFDLDKNGVIDAKVFVFNSNELVTEEDFLVFCSIFTKGIFHCRQLVCEIDLKAAENAVNVRSFFINSCR